MTVRPVLIAKFLAAHGLATAKRVKLAGDASFRRYERVHDGDRCFVLMDAPPPQEDVRPFVRVARLLAEAGLSAPRILGADVAGGLLLLEDLGDDTYNRLLSAGPEQETALYELAVDALIAIQQRIDAAGLPDEVPRLDERRAIAEAERFLEWYWPARFGEPPAGAIRTDFQLAWAKVLPVWRRVPRGLALFDFHIDNLLWLPDRPGAAGCGLLDFQDAVVAPIGFDLMSLIEDVRRDVPAALGRRLITRFVDAFPNLDLAAFRAAYAVAGAQRNIRILGTFVRLWKRDNKPGYLPWLDRTWRLVNDDLAHPAAAPLKAWFDRHISMDMRNRHLPGAPE